MERGLASTRKNATTQDLRPIRIARERKANHVFAAPLRKIHLPDFDCGYCADWMQIGRIEFHALGGGWENCDDSYSREHGAAACGYPDWEINLKWPVH